MISRITLKAANDDEVSQSTNELLHDHQVSIWTRTDRLFFWLMLFQWVAGIAAAIWITPRSWFGTQSEIHLHVWLAIALGGLIAIFPAYLVCTNSGTPLTRHIIAISQMLCSGLFIHLTGGRIETHFHIFGSLAFLASYRDWRVLVTATVVVVADHLIRGVFYPYSVFGELTASPWRVVEHAGWIAFENIFLIISIRQSVQEMKGAAWQRATLLRSNQLVEAEITARTCVLEEQAKDLQKSNQRAEQLSTLAIAADRSKSEFLANMSHEIRTPMTAILGFADILLDGLNDPAQIDAARTVKENGEYLITLINDILDLSKIESGKIEMERIPCSPHKIIADVASLMEVRAAAKNLMLQVRFDGRAPDSIQSDPTRLRQILINLVGNAIKFTEVGKVQIVARLLSGSDHDPKLQFDVIDTGIGIAESSLQKIFRPFTQADGSTTRKFGGTGLGLTITKRLVELLGGEISVSSTIGVGSTFSVTVSTGPLNDIQRTIQPTKPVSETGNTNMTTVTEAPLRNCHILLVEDGPDNQRLINFILKKAGAEVTLANNGQIGFDLATEAKSENRPFDVILMDMQMPVLDGYQATTQLRNHGYSHPIIALTAHAMATDRQKCLDAGCDEYLTKPVDRKILVETVAGYAKQATKCEHAAPALSGRRNTLVPVSESIPS